MLEIQRPDESMYNIIDEEVDPNNDNASNHLKSLSYSFLRLCDSEPERRKIWKDFGM